MASSTVRTFTDPDAYHATMRARRVDGVVTERGEFHAELTRIDFDRLLMQRADENLPRVLNMTTNPRRVAVIFAIDHVPSDMRVSGLPLSAGEIIAWDSGAAGHHKSAARAHPEVARAIEQDLIQTLVSCLTEAKVQEERAAKRRQAAIMIRLEEALSEYISRQLHPELSEL
jgi:hypothetical protein